MEKIVVKVPDYIKKFYINNKFGQPMAHEAARVLIKHAEANGAVKPKETDENEYTIKQI